MLGLPLNCWDMEMPGIKGKEYNGSQMSTSSNMYAILFSVNTKSYLILDRLLGLVDWGSVGLIIMSIWGESI